MINIGDKNTTILRLPLIMVVFVLSAYLWYDLWHLLDDGWIALSAALTLVLIGVVWRQTRYFWGAMVVLLFIGGAPRLLQLANHHWVLFYLTVAITIALSAPKALQQEIIVSNARFILSGMMILAVYQRVLSPPYMDGSFLGYCLASGSFGKLLFETGIFPNSMNAFTHNRSVLGELATQLPYANGVVILKPPFPAFSMIARIMVYVILVYECAMAFLFAIGRIRIYAHLLLWGFALGLMVIRPEAEFIAITLCLGMLTTKPEQKRTRRVYSVLIVFCLILLFMVRNAKHVVL